MPFMKQWLLILLVVSVTAAVVPSHALAGDHSWIVGMARTCANITSWWHSDEANMATHALDITACSENTAGIDVYYQDYGYAGDLAVYFRDHTTQGTNCTGINAELYDYWTGRYLYTGVHYVHIVPANNTIGYWFGSHGGWNIYYLGRVASSQAPGCWTGPHLHQSSVDRTGMWNNYGLGNPINPTGDPTYNWLHTLDRWW